MLSEHQENSLIRKSASSVVIFRFFRILGQLRKIAVAVRRSTDLYSRIRFQSFVWTEVSDKTSAVLSSWDQSLSFG